MCCVADRLKGHGETKRTSWRPSQRKHFSFTFRDSDRTFFYFRAVQFPKTWLRFFFFFFRLMREGKSRLYLVFLQVVQNVFLPWFDTCGSTTLCTKGLFSGCDRSIWQKQQWLPACPHRRIHVQLPSNPALPPTVVRFFCQANARPLSHSVFLYSLLQRPLIRNLRVRSAPFYCLTLPKTKQKKNQDVITTSAT